MDREYGIRNTAKPTSGLTEDFQSYARSLENLAKSCLEMSGAGVRDDSVASALDGMPGIILRETVPYQLRKQFGAFASGETLSNCAVDELLPKFCTNELTCLDPACGTGDLLLAYARRMTGFPYLSSTLRDWGRRILGFDVHPEFVQITKARLVLLAMTVSRKFRNAAIINYDDLFPLVQHADGIAAVNGGVSANNIVLNPPFTMTASRGEQEWSTGQVSAAAVFLDACVSRARPGTRISAILPDVLRSGTRYRKWRGTIESRVCSLRCQPVGLFDKWCDVDVFLFCAIAGSPEDSESHNQWLGPATEPTNRNVSDLFEVKVGSVVPHRHREVGPDLPYITAKGLPTWRTVQTDSAPRRGFSGTAFNPPFVVVRRTSRPDTHGRAIATIVEGSEPVAVENHLVVFLPKDHSYHSCEELLRVLRCARTDLWLDTRIRCRHLTTAAMLELPWWED